MLDCLALLHSPHPSFPPATFSQPFFFAANYFYAANDFLRANNLELGSINSVHEKGLLPAKSPNLFWETEDLTKQQYVEA